MYAFWFNRRDGLKSAVPVVNTRVCYEVYAGRVYKARILLIMTMLGEDLVTLY